MKFLDSQMQKAWDICNQELPERLWQAIATEYIKDNTPPNGHILQMTYGYLLCLEDQGKTDKNLEKFYKHVITYCPQY